MGDGVAHLPNGTPLYAPGAAPGDEVDDSGAVIAHGPNRAAPVCLHFGVCGGCQLQHVTEAVYRQWLGDRIVMALRQHEILAAVMAPAHLSPPRTRRRARMRAIRTAGGVILGFNEKRAHRIVDVADCPVLHPALQALVAPLRALLRPLMGEGRAVLVDMTLSDSGIDLILADLARQGLAGQEALAAFADSQDLARLSLKDAAGIDILVERRAPVLHLGGTAAALPPEAFMQATRDGEAALIQAVLDMTGPAAKVADLFCGIGTFALPLAAAGHVVHGADAAGPSVKALDRAARAGARRLTSEHRDLFRRPLTTQELSRFDAVVLDPPRAGAQAQCQALAQSAVQRTIMVSCNPNSFARDARLLIDGGYRLKRVQPVGQFLWSTHIELAALFERPGG